MAAVGFLPIYPWGNWRLWKAVEVFATSYCFQQCDPSSSILAQGREQWNNRHSQVQWHPGFGIILSLPTSRYIWGSENRFNTRFWKPVGEPTQEAPRSFSLFHALPFTPPPCSCTTAPPLCWSLEHRLSDQCNLQRDWAHPLLLCC